MVKRRGSVRVIGVVVALGLVIGLPSLVGAVQNIFTGFGQITDIQFEGSNIDQVVYQGTVLWERNNLPVMQSFNAANCPIERTKVRDARDGATYWIRKIPGTEAGGGDLCWMETNLAYAGGGVNTYGDVSPAITQGFTEWPDYIWTSGRYFIPEGSNRTSGTTDPSTSTDGGATNPQYGYLYNMCAAMANQPEACSDTVIAQPNQSVNPGNGTVYNVCPKGWRLPIGGSDSSTSEFGALNVVLNGGSTSSPAGLLSNGLFMYSGALTSAGFYGLGEYGYFHTSTASTADARYSYNFWYDATSITYGHNGQMNGFAVRCVAP